MLSRAKCLAHFPTNWCFSHMHNLLTVKETAKYLRIPLPTVYYLVQRGQLPAIQIGGRWRIKKSSLDKDILKEDKSGQPTVLVVDDDESLQNLFKLFLKKIGFSRVVVGTVKEAIAALEKQKFDLVFLDLKLPDGPADDGFEKAAQDGTTATNGENSWAQRRGQTRRVNTDVVRASWVDRPLRRAMPKAKCGGFRRTSFDI